MDPQLSNAVSHAFFRVLDVKIHHIEWKRFLLTFGSTSWERADIVFTLYYCLKWLRLLPKGQQKLTIFSDLIEEGLSYLQLFLELPEPIWSLQNVLYIKNSTFPVTCPVSYYPTWLLASLYMRQEVKLDQDKTDTSTDLEDFEINMSFCRFL